MSIFLQQNVKSIVGSVVECSPATRAARVRFPDDALLMVFFVLPITTDSERSVRTERRSMRREERLGSELRLKKKVVETGGIDPPTSHMLSERSTI